MTIETLIEGVIGREGGFSDHPADRGGPTRWGITEAVARANGYAGAMRDFPREDAVIIYRRLYWERPGLDQLALRAPALAARMFDTGVNIGPAAAIGFLVRVLNVLAGPEGSPSLLAAGSGVTGAVLARLGQFLDQRGGEGEQVLIKAVNGLQAERYVRLAERRPANRAFIFGWLKNRID